LRWTNRIIAGVAVAIVVVPLLVWGLVILLVTADASKTASAEARNALQQRYAKSFDGVQKVELLEVPEQSQSPDIAASASINVRGQYPVRDVVTQSSDRRMANIHALQYAEEECKRLARKVAAQCVVVDPDVQSSMKLEFMVSGQPGPDRGGRSGVIDALRLRYVDQRTGDDAAGREEIYGRIADSCRETKVTIGPCRIVRISLSSAFSVDEKGQKRSTTNGSADILVMRKEEPES
jgi:hypothetical protein